MAFRKPIYKVEINGQDYTNRFLPLVKTIEVRDKDGLVSDTASVTLADIDGQIALPDQGDLLAISLGHVDIGAGLVFEGFIDEVRSEGSKGGGRELQISAKGVDSRSKAKEQMQRHKDDATFGDVAKEWGAAAGLKGIVIADALAKIEMPYWAMQGESFIHWGQRMARELGATFKIQGGRGIFVETNGGKTASGKDLPEIDARLGVDGNLLRWSISPVVSRPRHKTVKARYYDAKEAKWKEAEAEVSQEGAEADHTTRFSSSDEAGAKRKSKALKGRAERNSGEGTVTIVGTADAKPEAVCNIIGARPGIDGAYRIEGVTHSLSKSGYTTSLDLKQPQGTAGKDTRKSSSSPSSSSTGASAPAGSSNAEAGVVPPSNIG